MGGRSTLVCVIVLPRTAAWHHVYCHDCTADVYCRWYRRRTRSGRTTATARCHPPSRYILIIHHMPITLTSSSLLTRLGGMRMASAGCQWRFAAAHQAVLSWSRPVFKPTAIAIISWQLACYQRHSHVHHIMCALWHPCAGTITPQLNNSNNWPPGVIPVASLRPYQTNSTKHLCDR